RARVARAAANRVGPGGRRWKGELGGRIGRGGGDQTLAVKELDRGGGEGDAVALGGTAHRGQAGGNRHHAQVGARRDAPDVGEQKWCDQHRPKATPACTPHQTASVPRPVLPRRTSLLSPIPGQAVPVTFGELDSLLHYCGPVSNR